MNPGMWKWPDRIPGSTLLMQWLQKGWAGLFIVCLCFWACPAGAWAEPLAFSVHTLDSKKTGATALIVGGIQGDEPGGFNAAALIATRYKVHSGRVIVVPNLNFSSIVKRSRGIHGDMNRKFARLHPDDPERDTIDRIKSMMTDPKVDFILNLHDGSGFYSKTYENSLRHPGRWGQSIIIDQEHMPGAREDASCMFSDLGRAAGRCARDVNNRLLESSHRVAVKNTRTARGNMEMAKTLTFFALKHRKPAFGIEASKSFLTPRRVYYHLLAIESFLTQAGIRFERDFSLTESGIKKAMDKDIVLQLGDQRILLFAENIRRHLNFIPMEKDRKLRFDVNHPLLTLIPNGDGYHLFHGNRRLTSLSPQYFEYDLGLERIEMVVDGRSRSVAFGSQVPVRERFLVKHIPDHRVNIIGFSKPEVRNESGFVVRKTNFAERFSIDRAGRIYRVEVYRDNRFNGMILVDFRSGQTRINLADVRKASDGKKEFLQ